MFGDMVGELARLHVQDLQREAKRVRRYRTAKAAGLSQGCRIGCLWVEGQA